jgi:uncharacterized protein (DUF885 family)
LLKHLGWMPFALAALIGAATCDRSPGAPARGPGDDAFGALAGRILEAYYRRYPTEATDLGIHRYDHTLEDYSAGAVAAEISALRSFKTELDSLPISTLSPAVADDRDQLMRTLDALLLQAEVIKPRARNPDVYASGLTNAAYVLIKRNFAPPADRLRALVARMRAMPAAVAEARRNLSHPPRVYTEIAIEQIDGNREFFRMAVPAAFTGVGDIGLRKEFAAATSAVLAAFDDYKRWLLRDLLPRSDGEFAYGAGTYRKRLWAEERIDVPLDELLTIARADLKRNQAAFVETARRIDPARSPVEVLAAVARNHPPPERLLGATQDELDALASFLVDRRIVTVPQAPAVRVTQTPPFLRATTTASMDIPGPFEANATEAYYNMTLPNPAWPAAEQRAFMEQWYYPAITNVSVHEVWPGHYLQFLYAKHLTSDVRKVFRTATNSEGWAHYVEQMMIDEGFHASDPRYRLAQLQDALLRNVRFIVGIAMHTQGMTTEEAERMFVEHAYQPAPVARAETRRGTFDATYGYYTMGKLMILKLREDYRAREGAAFSLQAFHDAFIRIGPLPLPLVRRAMLGEIGTLF